MIACSSTFRAESRETQVTCSRTASAKKSATMRSFVIPTGLVRIESNALGKPMGRIVKQFGEMVLDQSVIQLESIAPTTGRAVAVPPAP